MLHVLVIVAAQDHVATVVTEGIILTASTVLAKETAENGTITVVNSRYGDSGNNRNNSDL